MKTLIKLLFLLDLLILSSLFSFSQNTRSELMGSWEYKNESIKNDFQTVINIKNYSVERFVFEEKNKFKHEFLNENGDIVKVLYGKWLLINNKIKISYSTSSLIMI